MADGCWRRRCVGVASIDAKHVNGGSAQGIKRLFLMCFHIFYSRGLIAFYRFLIHRKAIGCLPKTSG